MYMFLKQERPEIDFERKQSFGVLPWSIFINPASVPGYHDLLNKVWRDKKKLYLLSFAATLDP